MARPRTDLYLIATRRKGLLPRAHVLRIPHYAVKFAGTFRVIARESDIHEVPPRRAEGIFSRMHVPFIPLLMIYRIRVFPWA